MTAVLASACVPQEQTPRQPAAAGRVRPAASPAAMVAGPCTTRLVTGDGVGPLRVFMIVDSLKLVCPVVGNGHYVEEGQRPGQLVSVAMGADTAIVVARDDRIDEIRLTGPGYATAQSLGIGTPLHTFLAVPGISGAADHGRITLRAPSICAVEFRIHVRAHDDKEEGWLDSLDLAGLPQDSPVDQLTLKGGCEAASAHAAARARLPLHVDTLLSRDLDGDGSLDYVVREVRQPAEGEGEGGMRESRMAVYLDGPPSPGRTPAWSEEWDFEGEHEMGETHALPGGGSLIEIGGNNADYTSEALLVVRNGQLHEEISHGEDYGEGYLEVLSEGGHLVVDATQMHLAVRGLRVRPELKCETRQWPLVRLTWDPQSGRFTPGAPHCIKGEWPKLARPTPADSAPDVQERA